VQIFANPDLPEIDDYYEPFTYDYARLQNAPLSEAAPTARPVSQITGEKMDKITWGPNWEDDLAGEFEKRAKDRTSQHGEGDVQAVREHLPHVPAADLQPLHQPGLRRLLPVRRAVQARGRRHRAGRPGPCRGWRMCIPAARTRRCSSTGNRQGREVHRLLPARRESGMPTVCSESCVGRIRYNGIILYDADKILEALASVPDEQDLYQAHLDIFVDPFDPRSSSRPRRTASPTTGWKPRSKSPIYKMAVEWKIAFPLHPEFRTLPMIWYVPPLSPVQSQIDQKRAADRSDGVIPKVAMRLPVKYLANLLTAGKEQPIVSALNRMIAMRSYQRSVHVEGTPTPARWSEVGMSEDMAKEMYRYLAIANYEDRFVIPTSIRKCASRTTTASRARTASASATPPRPASRRTRCSPNGARRRWNRGARPASHPPSVRR
jgi:nitrate reductase beta subunit